MTRKWAAFGAAVALAVQVVVVGGATPAHAYIGPGDDRQKATATGWWWYTNVDAAYVNARLSANNARLTDLRVYSTSPLRFTVAMVSNAGTYASGWWWYYGLTATQVANYSSTNKARVITAHAYNTSAGLRWAVVMVNNQGVYGESWWFYIGTISYLQNRLSANQARMVNFHRAGNGQYVGVMARNTGNDATPWWWYTGVSTAQISSYTAQNKAYIVDLDRNPNGTWNVVMYRNTYGVYWWWYVNQSIGLLHDRAMQLGARLIDVTPYNLNGTIVYAGVMVNNLNALSTKVRELYRSKVTSGHYGFEMKQVGGPIYAGLQETRKFEPASTLKVLYHLHSIRAQQNGSAFDSDVLTFRRDPANPNSGGICPDNFSSTSTTTLVNGDQLMMWNSDNRMTRAILEKYTKPSVLNTATSVVGTTGTAINHNIGCPTATTHNWTTLEDIRRIYEGVQNGTLVTNDTWEATFKSRMLNQGNFGSWKTNSFCPLVKQEATSLGKSLATANSFCNAATWYAKGGSYQYGGSLPYKIAWSGGSMTGVPFKSGGDIVPKYYYFGDWVDEVNITSTAQANSISAARSAAYVESLRSSVRAALTTWA